MAEDFVASVVAGYERLYGPPTRIVRFSRAEPTAEELAVVIYLPDEDEQQDPEGNLTLLGTAGFGAKPVCRDFPCELGIEVVGPLGDSDADALAEALVDLGVVPLENGRPFVDGQLLENVTLPVFPRFTTAMLVDRDPVDGFRFPPPLGEVAFLRLVPLFGAEAELVASYQDRHEAFLDLINRGMAEADPDREPVV